MGILIKMPAPRFERMPFKMRDDAIILTKCKQCGVQRVVSLADGSVYAWEKNHRCSFAHGTDKKQANGSNDAAVPRAWNRHRPS
jgi:hypothetical protein